MTADGNELLLVRRDQDEQQRERSKQQREERPQAAAARLLVADEECDDREDNPKRSKDEEFHCATPELRRSVNVQTKNSASVVAANTPQANRFQAQMRQPL